MDSQRLAFNGVGRMESSFGGSSSQGQKSKQQSLTNFFPVSRVPQQQKKLEEATADGFMYFPVTDISTQDLVRNGGRAKVVVNDKELALICHDNVVYAVQEMCPHAGGPLHLGDIEDVPGCGPHIKCPWHKWTFSLTTGECKFPRNRDSAKRVEIYPVQLSSKENVVKVGFNEISPRTFVTPPDEF